MANLENVSTEDLRQILAEVDDGAAVQPTFDTPNWRTNPFSVERFCCFILNFLLDQAQIVALHE
jgi:hypothetical protein